MFVDIHIAFFAYKSIQVLYPLIDCIGQCIVKPESFQIIRPYVAALPVACLYIVYQSVKIVSTENDRFLFGIVTVDIRRKIDLALILSVGSIVCFFDRILFDLVSVVLLELVGIAVVSLVKSKRKKVIVDNRFVFMRRKIEGQEDITIYFYIRGIFQPIAFA